jgi:N6-adenosine-specific RNA methylase IME4
MGTKTTAQAGDTPGGYRTIVADPPWNQKAGPLAGGVGEGFVFKGKQVSRDLPYPTMNLKAIKALPIADLAASDAHLYLWATNKYLPDAFEVVRAWGFTYSTTLVWAKNIMGGGLGGAYRVSTEYVIFARRGSLRELSNVSGTWFNWKRPYNAKGKPMHSAKPPEFFEMVEAVSPASRIELFARTRREGWDAWGDEVESDVDIAV